MEADAVAQGVLGCVDGAGNGCGRADVQQVLDLRGQVIVVAWEVRIKISFQ